MARDLSSRPLVRRGFGQTSRRDTWWVGPTITFLVLSLFIVYATWAAFQGTHYWIGKHYLSPFYSPEIWGDSPHAFLGPKPGWWPGWLPFSPALLILPIPAFFRLTCYYYRGAYYKAFWADPVACGVGEPRNAYRGEKTLPLVLQNVHRYFLYLALAFLTLLAYDAWKGMWFVDPATGVAAPYDPVRATGQTLISTFASVLVLPFYVAVMTLLYYDLRWRRGEQIGPPPA